MKKILIVDDVATNLICVAQVLKPIYEVSTAKSGRQALLMLNEMIPDLIMLDINMPVMNGYEVFEKLKANPEWASIPVVFLSAESDMTKEVKGFDVGAMDFIRKPFEPEVMKARIANILSISDQRIALEGAAMKDPLTSLGNRKRLEKFMNSTEGAEGYFMLLDLDNFKSVNDSFGHTVGDSVLIKMADNFKSLIKDENRICRLGGDEFAFFLPISYERNEIKTLVRQIIATSEYEINETLNNYSEKKISVSVGIAIKDQDGATFNELYANADKALYYVKQNGKRGYHFFDSMEESQSSLQEENTKINIIQLQRLIQETDDKPGVYKVEYDGFKKIYRFVSRMLERKGRDVQVALFSLTSTDASLLSKDNEFIDILGEAVGNSLRRGDVAAKCGESQWVVILMDVDAQNGNKVAERICKSFKNNCKAKDVDLTFEMETVGDIDI